MISSSGMRCARLGAGLAFAVMTMATIGAPANAAGQMVTAGLTSQPIGHYEFCKTNPAECAIRTPDNGPQQMSTKLWHLISSVNASVNKRVKPMNDQDVYGKDEVWAYPGGFGDCEDYVLEKRRELKDRGIPLSDLLITVVRKPDGEGHAVLTVRTDHGDYILDNLTDSIRPWDKTGYRFLKRQSNDHAGRWVAIRGGDTTLVGAVK